MLPIFLYDSVSKSLSLSVFVYVCVCYCRNALALTCVVIRIIPSSDYEFQGLNLGHQVCIANSGSRVREREASLM